MLMSFWVNIYLIQVTKMVWSDPDIFNSAGWKPLKPLNRAHFLDGFIDEPSQPAPNVSLAIYEKIGKKKTK